MATDQNAFFSVPLNTRVANACSPTAPDANWHGVLISAPQVVRLARGPGQAVAPICGLYRIELPRLLDDVPMLLKATDRATGRQFNGVLLDHDRGHPAPPPERPMIAC